MEKLGSFVVHIKLWDFLRCQLTASLECTQMTSPTQKCQKERHCVAWTLWAFGSSLCGLDDSVIICVNILCSEIIPLHLHERVSAGAVSSKGNTTLQQTQCGTPAATSSKSLPNHKHEAAYFIRTQDDKDARIRLCWTWKGTKKAHALKDKHGKPEKANWLKVGLWGQLCNSCVDRWNHYKEKNCEVAETLQFMTKHL